jgi:hypothetical protein
MWGVVPDEAKRCLLRDPTPAPSPQGGGEWRRQAARARTSATVWPKEPGSGATVSP